MRLSPASGFELSLKGLGARKDGVEALAVKEVLVKLAEKKRIAHVVDVFPFYGSDARATMGAGYDVKVAVIGPGVSASHGVERTHVKGIRATVQLVEAYLADIGNRKK